MLHIAFEFLGGPHDGRLLSGFLGEAGDAERYYLFTNHGTVGYLFKTASEYAVETLAAEQLLVQERHHFQKHYYVVTERVAQDEGAVYVRAEYVPEAVQAGQLSPR